MWRCSFPDGTAETFKESVGDGGHDGPDGRALRYLDWTVDPNPGDGLYEVHFACLLREGASVRVVHDRHEHALFSLQQWHQVLAGAGFLVTSPALGAAIHEEQVAFVARRPAR